MISSSRISPILFLAVCGAAATSTAPFVRASVVETDLSAANQTQFDGDISSSDLIDNSLGGVSSTVTTGSISSYSGDVAPYNSWSNLTDGAASTKGANGANDISHDTYFDTTSLQASPSPSITYKLNLTANPGGYTLTQIRSIEGWADTSTFSNQDYTVSYSTVAAPASFSSLATVNYAPFSNSSSGPNSSEVTLAGSGGSSIVSSVAALKFTFLNNGGSGQVFREIDVATSNSIPAKPTPPPPPPAGPSYMPLGDSITYGQGAPGGYRDKLFKDLQAADPSHTPVFVGSNTGNPSSTLTSAGQVNHEGHPGYRIDQITNNLLGNDGSGGNAGGNWLNASVQPNFILLHIGTNDILQHYDTVSGESEAQFLTDMEGRLKTLVQDLVTDRPNAHLLLSNLIPINNATNNAEVQQYNAYIQNTLVPQFAGQGVTFVDQYDNFVTNGVVNGALLPDTVHPNQQGYDMMGDTWAAAIAAVPEPSSTWVAASALMLLAGTQSRRSRRRV